MIYARLFETQAQYESYTGDTEHFVTPNVSYTEDNTEVHYHEYQGPGPEPPHHDYSKDCFTLIAMEDGCTFDFTDFNISLSTDGGKTWTEPSTETQTVTLNRGEKVLCKGNNPLPGGGSGSGSGSGSGGGRPFLPSSSYSIEGNIFSLYGGDTFTEITDLSEHPSVFKDYFAGDSYLISAENLSLPATTLAEHCYYCMFQGCTSLTTAPSLPATTLSEGCYNSMFQECTSLTTSPELPATTLTNDCYYNMFDGCTSLTAAPSLPATTLSDYCYTAMFQRCTSLTTAPELPATTLATSCYQNMFKGCTSLNYIKCLATSIPAMDCTNNWVNDVAASGTFVKNPSMSSWTTGANGIPSGWTVEDAS